MEQDVACGIAASQMTPSINNQQWLCTRTDLKIKLLEHIKNINTVNTE